MNMSRRVSKKTVVVSLVLATIISTPVISPVLAQQPDHSAMANLVIQVQELQDEVRTLRGQFEEQSRELENLKRRQRDQYLDLDQRLSDARNAQPVVGAGSGSSGAKPPLGPTNPPGQDEPEVRSPMESPSQVTGIGQPVAQSQSPAASAADEKAAYDMAFQALKELRYADAAEEFQSFLDQYPNSEYADNAQYWLGESYYVTRNYDIALKAFQTLLDDYPESPKGPDALLKVGYTHYELEQWDSARAALTQVQENYPDSTLSRLAENRLRSMRMEGHY
jgi:tol-pal system protein YbgF